MSCIRCARHAGISPVLSTNASTPVSIIFAYFYIWQHILMNSDVWILYLCVYGASVLLNIHVRFLSMLICNSHGFLWCSKMIVKLIAFRNSWNMVYCVWVCVPMCIWSNGCTDLQRYDHCNLWYRLLDLNVFSFSVFYQNSYLMLL